MQTRRLYQCHHRWHPADFFSLSPGHIWCFSRHKRAGCQHSGLGSLSFWSSELAASEREASQGFSRFSKPVSQGEPGCEAQFHGSPCPFIFVFAEFFPRNPGKLVPVCPVAPPVFSQGASEFSAEIFIGENMHIIYW